MALPVLPALPPIPAITRVLRRLPEAQCHALFVCNVLLERGLMVNGPSCHTHFAALLQSGIKDERALQEWLCERFGNVPARHGKAFSEARRQAECWLKEGNWAAEWVDAPPEGEGAARCPVVLFGRGSFEGGGWWAAFFNSRKSKLVSPHAKWLQRLRSMLDLVVSRGLGIAGSFGTISYDLVTAYAERNDAKLLLVVPQAIEAMGKVKEAARIVSAGFPGVSLSCQGGALGCPKATRMVCRDRLLAFLADLHCVVDIRPAGNLWKILARQQQEQPRSQLCCEEHEAGETEDRKPIPGSFQSRLGISEACPGHIHETPGKSEFCWYPHKLLDADAVPWGEYLYHYTRSCPGPWPGQCYRRYLESLLDAEPLAEHTALAALGRILTEGRVRAGSRIVRGNQAVVSWTARPPRELEAIRRWSAALIRWTFEPYGVAVKRSVLRRMGASPAIYAASAAYDRLPARERFRFQLHDPRHCSWKHEHEWRLSDDLNLSDLKPNEAFLFLPGGAEAMELAQTAAVVLPVVVLERGS